MSTSNTGEFQIDAQLKQGHWLVIGVGQRLHRDDGLGPAALEALSGLGCPADLRHAPADGAALIEMWSGYDRVLVIDAIRGRLPAGTICRWHINHEELPRDVQPSSCHLFSLAGGVGLAKVLGRLPATLIFIGVVGLTFSWGEGLSPPVHDALEDMVQQIQQLVSEREPGVIP